MPLVIQGHISPKSGVDNTVYALRRSSQVCKIDLWGSSGSKGSDAAAISGYKASAVWGI